MRRVLRIYLALLAVSWLVRWLGGALDADGLAAARAAAAVKGGAAVVEVQVVESAVALPVRGARRIPLAATLRRGAADAPVVVLLHGSPGQRADFTQLLERLPRHWTLLAPDLPGFGDSRAPVPDYSARAHADYVLQLLDATGIRSAHVLGFSMGSAVALEIGRMQPQRVASLTLLSGIGVQEMELFGNYELNHAIHAAQYWGLCALEWLVPHFGLFDGGVLDRTYARNFLDTDQRLLRGALAAWQAPALVIHGERDFLVPAAAAREHARLMPHSELVMLDASHFLPWTRSDEVAGLVAAFVRRVESGAALRREAAEPGRLAAAELPLDPDDLPPFTGPALLVAMLLLALGTLVSEDLTCIATGLLVAQGRIGLLAGSAACFLGIFVGDVLLYLAGRSVGMHALHRAPLRWVLTPGGVARAQRWFRRRGAWVIFLSRFMPGLRLPTYFAAGVVRTGLARFAFWFALAGLIWTPTLVFLASWAGRSLDDSLGVFREWAGWAFLVLLVAVYLLERLIVPLFTWRGRRMLRGRWRRRTHWEYWPRWVVYPPVLLAVLGEARRHGGLRVVTAVNPAIPTGGLAGESKSAILQQLLPGPEVARFRRLTEADRMVELHDWMEAEDLDYPVVLKPDCGERGREVAVVHGADQAREYLTDHPHRVLAQEHISGEEYGVFWVHEPGAARGRVWSIVHKVMPEVVGDGVHDLEHLVLAHPRHVAMATTLLDALGERAFDVPAAGQRVTVSALGTHCRGASFLDANALCTPALEDAVGRIAARCPGFRFGRFDLRVPDAQALQEGRGLRVLELNGLTSEAAHVYDPQHSFRRAVGVLRAQWRLAFRIAAANVAAGARPSSWRESARGLWGERRG